MSTRDALVFSPSKVGFHQERLRGLSARREDLSHNHGGRSHSELHPELPLLPLWVGSAGWPDPATALSGQIVQHLRTAHARVGA